ncbi:MAG TPA: hypothetical protein VFS14_01445 [Candidatus Saccharimonadales bacterium]|nr:hypothetical protein [Candidatus Saccharimonadales bacterium]
MSFFSDEDKAANREATKKKAEVEREHRRNAPRVAGNLVNLLEASARSKFRNGDEVREISASDGKNARNFVDKDILTEVLTAAVEERFRRDKSTFRLHLSQSTDWEDRDCWFHGNWATVFFDPPLT